jgi:aminopeptidase N
VYTDQRNKRPNSDWQVLVVTFVFLLLIGCVSVTSNPSRTSTPAAPTAVKGAPGIGDPYFPNLGNDGYDVQNYTIAMEVNPSTNNLKSSTTITADATEFLGSFNLDFHGLTVDSVKVNGTEASYSRSGDEITITPAAPLEVNAPFTTVVQYHGSPETLSSAGLSGMGWSHGESGVINAWNEPEAASTWFPSNNHPRDKATYRFEITVPDPWMVAATGTLKETKPDTGKTTYIWEMDKPMATYLASISIDQYELDTQSGPNGINIRNYFPKDSADMYRSRFLALPVMIDFLDDYFGPYPFSEYGIVIAGQDGLCENRQIALEAQTMSLHCPSAVMTSEGVAVHELAHQWFGDSVSLENWKDIWLKEGFATYASWLWESKNDPLQLAGIAREARSHFTNPGVPVAEPGPDRLYGRESYTGGALVLYALQQEVGDKTFFEILKTYSERYKYKSAGTDDFIAVAEEVSGRDLTSFFDAWLFSGTLPELPQ